MEKRTILVALGISLSKDYLGKKSIDSCFEHGSPSVHYVTHNVETRVLRSLFHYRSLLGAKCAEGNHVLVITA